ncbi:recombinase family protein [Arthrobacter sp. Ld5]|uniref:recombinase family protein n=1 Tax=Arthrobacter sp. Ld5 TaxID=649152 RepID=UPI003EBFDF8B
MGPFSQSRSPERSRITAEPGCVRRLQFDNAPEAVQEHGTSVVTTLGPLGRSTSTTLALTDELHVQKVNPRAINLGGGNVEIGTSTGSMVFNVMAAFAQMKLEIK